MKYSFYFTYIILGSDIMFGVETAAKGLSFTKILGGISKTLSIANQVIPIYQQAKPMIQNAKSAFKVVKEFTKPMNTNTTSTNSGNNSVQNQIATKNPYKKTDNSSPNTTLKNKPVFFL